MKETVCPYAPPYPASVEEMLEATRCRLRWLLEHPPSRSPTLVFALLVASHDSVHHAVKTMEAGGKLPQEEHRRLFLETRARVKAILDGPGGEGDESLH